MLTASSIGFDEHFLWLTVAQAAQKARGRRSENGSTEPYSSGRVTAGTHDTRKRQTRVRQALSRGTSLVTPVPDQITRERRGPLKFAASLRPPQLGLVICCLINVLSVASAWVQL
jgi:hypothetical protein